MRAHRSKGDNVEDEHLQERSHTPNPGRDNAGVESFWTRGNTLPSPQNGPSALQFLQQSAGNRAVQREVAVQRSGRPVVQRESPGSAQPAAAAHLDSDDIIFKRLPPGRGFMTGRGLNTTATQISALVLEGHAEAVELKRILGFLDWTEHVSSERDLESVEAASGTIARKSRGARGDRLRESVEGYSQANPSLLSQVNKLAAARSAVDGAVIGVHKAVTEQNVTAAERDEKTAGSALAAHQAKVAKAQKWADKVFDGVIDLVFDPKKVMDVVKGLVKFAGSELLIGPMIEGAYAFDTYTLTEQLRSAQRVLATLRDEVHLLAIEHAVKVLDQARASYRAELSGLVAATRKAEAEQATLLENLEGMGTVGEKAAGALDARTLAGEEAADGLRRVLAYQQILERISSGAKWLNVGYLHYAEFAASPGGKRFVADDMRRSQLSAIADSNASKTRAIEKWTVSELVSNSAAKEYLSGGSYMKKYDQIDSVLHEALMNR